MRQTKLRETAEAAAAKYRRAGCRVKSLLLVEIKAIAQAQFNVGLVGHRTEQVNRLTALIEERGWDGHLASAAGGAA